MITILLKISGALLILLSLMHIGFPKRFGWKEELQRLTLLSRQIMLVHTFFIALVVMMMGVLSVFYADDLTNSPFGGVISFGLAFFWLCRLFCQWFVYKPKLWRGKTFETAVHIIFSLLWIGLTVVFGAAAWIAMQ